jgi:hypothetical protein
MKNIIIVLAICLITNYSYSKENFTLVKEIDLNTLNTNSKKRMTIEFKSGKKLISKSKAIDINEIIEICDNCFAEIQDKNGRLYYISNNDLNKQINNQQALLLFDDEFSSLGDTLVIGEDDLSKLEGNKLLNVELGSMTNATYGLNSKNWSNDNKNKYFRPYTLVFPFDNNTNRWITDIRKIRIFKR